MTDAAPILAAYQDLCDRMWVAEALLIITLAVAVFVALASIGERGR